jgi:hypothetical protein
MDINSGIHEKLAGEIGAKLSQNGSEPTGLAHFLAGSVSTLD